MSLFKVKQARNCLGGLEELLMISPVLYLLKRIGMYITGSIRLIVIKNNHVPSITARIQLPIIKSSIVVHFGCEDVGHREKIGF